MNRLAVLASFVLGAGAGAAATWYILKEKHAKLLEEQIESFKAKYHSAEVVYDIPEESEPDPVEEAVADMQEMGVSEYAKILSQQGYTDYAAVELSPDVDIPPIKLVSEDHQVFVEKPYIIEPDEFGELYDYTTISLTYYADKYLTDENDELVEDVEDTVGTESLTHFGEYEDDSVFVRNDRLKCDYEILLDTRNYKDVIKTKSRPRENL